MTSNHRPTEERNVDPFNGYGAAPVRALCQQHVKDDASRMTNKRSRIRDRASPRRKRKTDAIRVVCMCIAS